MMAPKTTETKPWLQPLILGTYTVLLGFSLTYGMKFITLVNTMATQLNTLAATVAVIQESQHEFQQEIKKDIEKIKENGTVKDIQQDSRIDAVSERVDALRRQNREPEDDRFTYEGILPDRKYIQNERHKNRRTK